MAHEEHTARCSNGGGGGRILKKSKHNKVPQRGMGVAQLEKIIFEEKQSKDVAISTPNTTSFKPPVMSLPPPLSPNHRPSFPKTDSINRRTRTENPDPNLDPDPNREMGYRGYAVPIPTNLGGLPYECNPPIWPSIPSFTQRSQFLQPCSSSMMNISSSPTIYVTNFQMEPPSNQSYCSNKYSSICSEEEKTVGMKRSYPFSIEKMQIPFFDCKFTSAYMSPTSRFDGSASCSNGGITSLQHQHYSILSKEGLCGRENRVTDQMAKKIIDENDGLTKDFLTLAPPQALERSSSSKEKFPPLYATEPTRPPYQGQTQNSYGIELLNQQPLHRFFPAAKTHGNNNCEAGEHVDLNLKL